MSGRAHPSCVPVLSILAILALSAFTVLATVKVAPSQAQPPPLVSLLPVCVNGMQVDVSGATSGVDSVYWNWGDGSYTYGWFPQSHVYVESGSTIITVTGYYDDGASVQDSAEVDVGPGALSGCMQWTITSGPGGTVQYQTDVGVGSVPPGSPATLQTAIGNGGTLTANSSAGHTFAGWIVSGRVTGPDGSPINPTSNTITVIVNGTAAIEATFQAIGPRPTSTQVGCTPGMSYVPASIVCTAYVLGASVPFFNGYVSFSSSSSTGSFSPSLCAPLYGHCSTTYSDDSPGSPTVTATYSGYLNVTAGSSGSATLILYPPSPSPPSSVPSSSGNSIPGSYTYQGVSGNEWNFSDPTVCGTSTSNPQCEASDVDLHSTPTLQLVSSSGQLVPFVGVAVAYGIPFTMCQNSFTPFSSVSSREAVITACLDEALVVPSQVTGTVNLTAKIVLPARVTGDTCGLVTAQLVALVDNKPVSEGGPSPMVATQSENGSVTCEATFTVNASLVAELASAPSPKTAFGVLVHEPTTILCIASPVGVGVVTRCGATVTGNSPTGSITWSTGGSGAFIPAVCKLSRTGFCQVTYRATSGASPVPITAKYGGDSHNQQSEGVFPLAVLAKPSRLVITCSSGSLKAGAAAVPCIARVSGYKPSGTVVWSQTGTGTLRFSSTTCTLAAGKCTVTLTAVAPGSVTIAATYSGDPSNGVSSGTKQVLVRPG